MQQHILSGFFFFYQNLMQSCLNDGSAEKGYFRLCITNQEQEQLLLFLLHRSSYYFVTLIWSFPKFHIACFV